jgi:2-oxoglutarate dehydrogenase E2 component (dihydrolipoamide succinyltransferase)
MSKIEIKVPSAGESVTEATIASHLKQTGDVVSLDEHIFEIETDKASMPVPSPAAGKIEWHVKPGDVVKVGDVVGTIDDSFKAETKQIDKPKVKPEARPQPVEAPKGDVRKSADSFFSEQSSKPAPTVQAPEPVKEGRTTRKKMTKLRKIIAQKLVEVKNQTAMLTTFNEVDMTQIMAMREK